MQLTQMAPLLPMHLHDAGGRFKIDANTGVLSVANSQISNFEDKFEIDYGKSYQYRWQLHRTLL